MVGDVQKKRKQARQKNRYKTKIFGKQKTLDGQQARMTSFALLHVIERLLRAEFVNPVQKLYFCRKLYLWQTTQSAERCAKYSANAA